MGGVEKVKEIRFLLMDGDFLIIWKKMDFKGINRTFLGT